MRRGLTTVLTPVMLVATGAWAQHPVEIRHEKVIVGGFSGSIGPGSAAGMMHATPSDMVFVSSEFSFDAGVVKGAPYSADAVTEIAQRLGDGNTIRRKSQAQVFRDGEGRTRREETIEAIGPWAAGTPHKTVMINDPVAGAHYLLDPGSRTANKMPAMTAGQFNIKLPDGAPFPAMPTLSGAGQQTFTYVHGGQHGDAAAIAHSRTTDTAATESKSAPLVKTEQLGKRTIEGVEAEGTRTTMTIAAGQIGNDLPIETVSERWYSNDLKTVVMTRRNDPRMGETTYRLTAIRRGEPGRTLFEVPADYTVDEPKPGMMMRKRINEKRTVEK
ncbi:MAG: hypothetical protein EXQ52_12930 [Bryobacterales bacterium]|nr:hypothetical protein [Bryobacterales bacterium]